MYRTYHECICTGKPSRCLSAYAPDNLGGVPKTPNHIIRVDLNLWREYGEACAALGTNRSADLRALMLRRVKAWKKTQAPASSRRD